MGNTNSAFGRMGIEQGGRDGDQRRLPLRCATWRMPIRRAQRCAIAGIAKNSPAAPLPRWSGWPGRLTIEGTLKTFSSLGGSGNPILRHFCPECGSSIAEEPGTRPGMMILNIGTFDDPTVAKAGREIFRDDALPWVEVHGEIPRFAKRAD